MKRSRVFLFLTLIWFALTAAVFFDFSSQWNQLAGELNRKFGIEESRWRILQIPERPFKLGLDLQGGIHLVYEADLSNISPQEYEDAMEGLRDVIERRVNLFGVEEPVVQVEKQAESWRLIVELAGIRDTKSAISAIGETPFLEFREPLSEEETEKILAKREEVRKKFEEKIQLSAEDMMAVIKDPYFAPTSLTGRFIKRATLGFDSIGNEPLVLLEFDDEGKKLFAELTKKHLGKPLAIAIDDQVISAPTIQAEITTGQAQISGNFSLEEARTLVRNLNAGALPIPITIISQQTVEASLGEESLSRSLKAALWGVLGVIIFMLVVYRMGGVIAVLGLLLYGIFILAVFKMIAVTLTLAGIAGFILSFGMAVDANVLILERMREEKKKGRDFNGMVREGFSRAWPAIRDGHITTLISTVIMFVVGTGFLQGFALTLGIGVLMSLFSAVVFVRLMMWLMAETPLAKWRAIWTR